MKVAADKRRRLNRPTRDLLIVGAVGLLGLGAVGMVEPTAAGIWPACAFHGFTGWHCPLCGGLRSLHDAAHGRLLEAVSHNAFAITLLLPAFGVQYALAVRRAWLVGETTQIQRGWIVALVVAALVFTLARNVPVPPLAALTP